jgi:hypothetical protein
MIEMGFRPATAAEKKKYAHLLKCSAPADKVRVRRYANSGLTEHRRAASFSMTDKRIYVERRSEGDYAVRRAGSERASAVASTQAQAIQKARELNPGVSPRVERVRNTETGGRDKWRKA